MSAMRTTRKPFHFGDKYRFRKNVFLSERIFSLNLNELGQGFHSQTIRNCSKFFFSEISKHNKKTISMISCTVEFYIISLKQGFGADLFGGGSGNFLAGAGSGSCSSSFSCEHKNCQRIVKNTRVSEPACFGAAQAWRIFFPEPAPASEDILLAFCTFFEVLKYV